MRLFDIALSKTPILDIYSQKKVINNNFLNKKGLQAYRVRLAEKNHRNRKFKADSDILPFIRTLESDGILVIPNFLEMEEFEQLEKDCLLAKKEIKRTYTRNDGPNQYSNIKVESLNRFCSITKIANKDFIRILFNAAERRSFPLTGVTRLLEILTQGVNDTTTVDPETELHEDIFFNTHKAWLYVSDVTPDNGLFVYVKNSHDNIITNREYYSKLHSLTNKARYSQRIDKDQLKYLGLKEMEFFAQKIHS